MSINHFSGKTPSNSNHQTLFSTTDSAAAFWAGPTAAFRFNLNNEDDQAAGPNNARDHLVNSQVFEQEKLFEKPLTPSDVGKLNRLVIPKQHAEKYFPLGGGGEAGEKGLLLGFEDEVGKPWRFRYSYWNSSQSYVLTKGWSRFVKEKRLDAGDVVLFGRHRFDFGRLFIGWRRRNSGAGICPCPPQHLGSPPSLSSADKQTVSSRNGNSKRLIRLFGVNLEWSEDESEPSTSESSAAAHRQPYNQY